MKKIIKYLIIILVMFFFVGCGEEPTPTPGPIDDPKPTEHTHDFVHHEGKAATCLEDGWEEYDTCNTCNYTSFKKIEALGHDYKLVESKDPTCIDKGYKKYQCTRCNDEKQEEIEVLGHDIIHYEKEDATCEHEGHEEYDICSRCGYHTEIITIPQTDHEFEETVVEATVNSTGYVLKKCKHCEEEIMEYKNPLNRSDEQLQDLKVLFIGNSFTNYNTMVKCFEYIAEAQGIRVSVVKVAYGSAYLYNFIEGKDGKYLSYVDEATRNTKFDVVFLQEQSNLTITEPSRFYYACRKLKDYFDKIGTTCILYQTWGYPRGYDTLINYGPTTELMANRIGAAYEAIADELGVSISHAGTSMCYMYQKYKEQDETLLYASLTNNHPSAIGTYLVALTHFATLYGRSVKGINYKYVDYANQSDITWHATKVDSIEDSMQNDIEDIVDKAVFGPSFVLDEYKTSSVGVEWDPNAVQGFKQTITIDNVEDESAKINVTYKMTSGKWTVGTDAKGTTSFMNNDEKSTLMFQEELAKDKDAWHTISFDLLLKKELNNLTYARGILFGADNPNLQYFGRDGYDGTEATILGRRVWDDKSAFTAMRCWNGEAHGKSSNYSFDGVNVTRVEHFVNDLNRNYHIQILFNLNEMKYGVYVNGKLSGIVDGVDLATGGYIGILVYDSARMQFSNFKFDGQRMIFSEAK